MQSSAQASPKHGRVRVLVVDHAAVMRLVATTILRTAGFAIAGEAATPAVALELQRSEESDVILIDVESAEIAPAQARLAILAESPAARVVVSAYSSQRAQVDAALAAGAVAYVAKPWHPQRLIDIVREVVADPEDVRTGAENTSV